MTTEELKAAFAKFDSEYGKFDRIPEGERVCGSPDACALVLLSNRFELNKRDVLVSAEHDQVWLFGADYTDCDDWPLTDDDVLFLVRCGVYMSEEDSSLCMCV